MKAKLNILIVDDTDLVHKPIANFLKNFVFTEIETIFHNAYNLEQAKHLMQQKKFDLVMLDGDVGNGWGYEIIPNILQHNPEVIIVSSSNFDEFNVQNVDFGAHASVNKTYIYEWNDENAEYRNKYGLIIKKLFDENLKNKST